MGYEIGEEVVLVDASKKSYLEKGIVIGHTGEFIVVEFLTYRNHKLHSFNGQGKEGACGSFFQYNVADKKRFLQLQLEGKIK